MTPLSFSRGQMVREATLTKPSWPRSPDVAATTTAWVWPIRSASSVFSTGSRRAPLEILTSCSASSRQLGLDEARIADYALGSTPHPSIRTASANTSR